MNSTDQVQKIIEQYKENGVPLSDAVWGTALACVGWPYVFGAWGEECTPANRKRRAREDHPTIVSKCQVLNGSRSSCSGCQWDLPVRMFDCRGFTDWCLKQYKIDLKGEGATSQWNTESNWKAKGTIDTIPDDILVCLFVKDGSKMSHTGFGYKGESCECSSGVQHFTKRKAKWSHWAIPAGIDGEIPDYRPTLRRGDKGPYVTLAQTELVQKGYDIGKAGIDGDFGRATEAAVKALQADFDLKVDGIIGPRTWEVLDGAAPVLYTVTIQHVTKSQAEQLVKTYAGATMTEEGR
jgi:hypothetical protein